MTVDSPLTRYQSDLDTGLIQADAAQQQAVTALDDLFNRVLDNHNNTKSLAAKFKRRVGLSKLEPVKGLYFWGGVGRGKTYLMDLFYETLPFEQKLRTHFHRFMRRVHAELKILSKQSDPLEKVAQTLADEYSVICFDEFFVVDITDAMILANLLDGLFRRGVCLVATSNIEPLGLYKDGLQRARFLPAIVLLETHTQILNVDGGVDYRLRALKQAPLYHYPCSAISRQALQEQFDLLSANSVHCELNPELEIEGRAIKAIRVCDDIAWFDFYAVCDGPRSQNDYIELAREYQTVLLSSVPTFTEKNDDQARRFIYLIDEFYDRHVKMVMEAEAPFFELYRGGRLSFEFQRTVSRIQEMQSEAYLASEHKA